MIWVLSVTTRLTVRIFDGMLKLGELPLAPNDSNIKPIAYRMKTRPQAYMSIVKTSSAQVACVLGPRMPTDALRDVDLLRDHVDLEACTSGQRIVEPRTEQGAVVDSFFLAVMPLRRKVVTG